MTATPGHGGKECKELDFWKKRTLIPNRDQFKGMFYYIENENTNGTYAICCPACGLRLQPDPKPLPVPEGCIEVVSRACEDALGFISWTIIGRAIDGTRVYELRAKSQQAGESAWRRAFQKEGM